jgi:hypothetical protein
MVIKVDMEGQEMVKQLCDVALKAGGLSSLDGVMHVLRSVKLEKEELNKEDVKAE